MGNMTNKIVSMAQVGKEIHITCETDFNMSNALLIKEALLESVERDGDEVLSLTAATSIDVSGIQLAFSWKNALLAKGRKADVLLPVNESIKDLLVKTGITQIF
jgi:anti-anti-sigma regulatory factor